MDQEHPVVKLAWLSHNQLVFRLEQYPEKHEPFTYSFIFDQAEEVSLWLQMGPHSSTLRLTVSSIEKALPLLHNQLLLALLVMTSSITINRRLGSLRSDVTDIFDALGIRLKWTKQNHMHQRWYMSHLEDRSLLVTNLDLLSFQQVYYEKKGDINVETIAALKQYNAYNYVKEQAQNALPQVLRHENFEQYCDRFIEDLRITYTLLSASSRIKCRGKKWTFDNLELYIQKELASSALRPVVTVLTDTLGYEDQQYEEYANSASRLSAVAIREPEINQQHENGQMQKQYQHSPQQIQLVFESRFNNIQKSIDQGVLQVDDFKEEINNFVKQIATDLQSQENLVLLMEFLLAKTFRYFQNRAPSTAANLQSVNNFVNVNSTIQLQEPTQQFSQIQLNQTIRRRKHALKQQKERERVLMKRIRQLQNQLYISFRDNNPEKLEERMTSVLKIKDTETKSLKDEINQIRKYVQAKDNENIELMCKLKEMEKTKNSNQHRSLTLIQTHSVSIFASSPDIHSSPYSNASRPNRTTTAKQISSSSFISVSSVNESPIKNTVKKPAPSAIITSPDLKSSASMKQLGLTAQKSRPIIGLATITPKAESGKSTKIPPINLQSNFNKKSTMNIGEPGFGVRSPKIVEVGKKTTTLKKSEESATVIKNLSSMISYVQEQSKNLSQRGTAKGKQNLKKI